MTSYPELIFLDVGHGSCTLLIDNEDTVIVDCAPGPTLIETLKLLRIHKISSILISHADHDHIGGIITLLSNLEIEVQNIFLNPDALRDTEIWTDLKYAIKDAKRRGNTKVNIGLTTSNTGQLDTEQVKIEVIAPSPELAMSGVGGKDLQGQRLSSHAMSVVIGLVHNDHRVAVLPGDINEVGLSNLVDDCEDLKADILLFPHHGGNSGGGDNENFAYSLCTLVRPIVVFFSFDRNRFSNPREEVIKGIKLAGSNTRIMCTQLSKKCSSQVPNSDFNHLSILPSKGRINNCCCGGTMRIILNGQETIHSPLFPLHQKFIKEEIMTPICLKKL